MDFAAARRALAALRISIARGSRPICIAGAAAFFATGLVDFGVACGCWPTLQEANSTPAAKSRVRPTALLKIMFASVRTSIDRVALLDSRNHSAFEHLVDDRRGDLVEEL